MAGSPVVSIRLMGWRVHDELDEHGEIHVWPEFDGERSHDLTGTECWCGPRRHEQEDRLIVHDRRAEA